MDLNVNKIIQDKIHELEENHVIENAIQEKIESVIKNAVDSAFNWEFSQAISDEIKKQVGNIAESVKLNSYNTLIAETIKNITENELKEDLAVKVQAKIRDMLLVTDHAVKFSDIVKKFKEICCDDENEYSYEVVESNEEHSGGFYYKKFDFKPDNDGEKLAITFSRYNTDPWKIFSVRYDNETKYSTEGISTLKKYDSFECLILKCLLNKLPIELDFDAEDCEEELHHYFD